MTASPRTLVKQFLEHRDGLLAFIFALTRDYDLAEEVFQQAAQVILEEAERSAPVTRFFPWACEIARRRVAEHYRRQQRRPTEQLGDVIDRAFAENDQVQEEHVLRLKYLDECRARLTGRSREVIESFYRDRKSIREVAAALGWQENSVKVALSRARRLLADCLKEKMASTRGT